MPFPVLVADVEADIDEALLTTLEGWGVGKYLEYIALLEEALIALSENPYSGRRKPEIHPDAWVYPIRKPGRRARHVFLYEVLEDKTVQVYGLTYDGKDLPRVWRERNPR